MLLLSCRQKTNAETGWYDSAKDAALGNGRPALVSGSSTQCYVKEASPRYGREDSNCFALETWFKHVSGDPVQWRWGGGGEGWRCQLLIEGL